MCTRCMFTCMYVQERCLLMLDIRVKFLKSQLLYHFLQTSGVILYRRLESFNT